MVQGLMTDDMQFAEEFFDGVSKSTDWTPLEASDVSASAAH